MRLAVLSNHLLNPWINWSTLGPPLLSPLSSFDDSELVAPPPLKFSNLSVWREVAHKIRKADTLFWIQGAGRPENPLIFSMLFNPRARRSAFVDDAFEPVLFKVGIAATIGKLNPCFVAYREHMNCCDRAIRAPVSSGCRLASILIRFSPRQAIRPPSPIGWDDDTNR